MTRLQSSLRRSVAGLLGVGALLVPFVSTSTQALAAELSDAGSRAFADVAACAAESDHLLAAIVVDASGSLRQTDPLDQRVGGIGTALDALEQLGASSAGSLDVEATLATFGASYEEVVGWGTVADDHADALRSAAASELPGRDRENYTDYRAALRGAQQSLDARAAALDGSSCKVLLWFTDGRLDVDGTGAGAASESARAELCAPMGIVDGLRGGGIAVIALALFMEGGSASVTDQDRERLRAVAEGSGSGETCGTVPLASTSSGGAYLRADDAGAMRRLFAQASALIAGGTTGLSAVCPDDLCVAGRLAIPTDAGTGGFRIVLERSGGATPQLVAADGTTAELTPALTTLAGASVAVTDRDGLMTADVGFAGGADGGSWTLVADASASTLVDLYYFWGISLGITADELLVGEQGIVRIAPLHRDGSVVDVDALGSADLTVTIGDVPVVATWTGEAWEALTDVPTADIPPSLHVEVTAAATTRPSETRLGPVSARADLSTSFPPSYPTVGPARLDLPSVMGAESTTGTLTVTGSERGATQVCFGPAEVNAPETAGDVIVSTLDECVDVEVGEVVDVVVTASPENAADGRVDGALPVRLIGVDGSEPLTVSVPFGFSMTRPVDEGTRWVLVALFSLAAILLAWLVAEVARRAADRYVLTLDARVASVPVAITGASLRRTDSPDAPILDPASDFEPLEGHPHGRLRSFSTRGVQFGRSFPVIPLRSGTAWVTDRAGSVVAGPGPSALTGVGGNRAPVRFPGTSGFVFVAERPRDDSDDLRGRLLVVVDSREGVAAVLPERLEEITAAPWDRIAEAVRSSYDGRDAISAVSQPSKPASVEHSGSAEPQPVDGEDAPPSTPPGMAAGTTGWWDEETSALAPPSSPRGGESGPARRPAQQPAGGGRRLFGRRRADPVRSSEPPPVSGDDPPHTSSNFWE